MTATAVSRGHSVRVAVHRQLLLLMLMLGPVTPPATLAAERAEPQSPAVSIVDGPQQAVSYALVREHGGTVFVGQQDELMLFRRHKPQLENRTGDAVARPQTASDYLWIRDGDTCYVIDDPVLLTEVLSLWRSVEPHEQALEKMSVEMQHYTEQLELHAARLDSAMADGEPVNIAALEAFERVSEPLQAQIEPLGEQMAALGKLIEAGSDTAHQRTVALIQSALASGAATPVPGD